MYSSPSVSHFEGNVSVSEDACIMKPFLRDLELLVCHLQSVSIEWQQCLLKFTKRSRFSLVTLESPIKRSTMFILVAPNRRVVICIFSFFMSIVSLKWHSPSSCDILLGATSLASLSAH